VAAAARLVARIHEICAEFPRYGYRRVTAQLKAEGERVNHKRVARIMREQDLRVRPERRFVATTDSDHHGPVFPNPAKDLAPSGPDQLWVADLTYIRILSGFVYLAVILDAWSRRVVGRALRGRLRRVCWPGGARRTSGRCRRSGGQQPLWRHAMWTVESRALVGDFGAGQALSDEQFALLEPMIPPARPGGRPRTTDMRRLLDGLFHLVRTGCQWRHLPPPPAFPPWRTVYGHMRAFASAGVWGSIRHRLVVMLREREGREPSPTAAIVDTQSVKTTEKGGLAATTRPRRSRAGSATSRSTPRACCWAWSSMLPLSRTRTASATS
jgi:transposase